MAEPAVLSMVWRDALFAHWPVEPSLVAERLPDRLSVDTHDGEAYLGVVPFVMEDISPRGVPFGLSFGEINLRTYVRGPDGTPGIYFFNLDADDRLGVFVAWSLFELPYYRAEITVERGDREVRFRSRRVGDAEPAAFDATYSPVGERFEAEPGSLPHFLTERYRFYTEGRDRLYYGDIDHEPWALSEARAEIRENDLFRVNGFAEPDGDPLLHYAPRLDVTAGRVHRV
ncbi:YqjF family protein [Halosegnis marinus]|uniref:YqjF family protein n=1 Tax=Halosegnis marinus TaxID=3034023 RepID=A0ABD5ZKI7_9EURY